MCFFGRNSIRDHKDFKMGRAIGISNGFKGREAEMMAKWKKNGREASEAWDGWEVKHELGES